MNVRFVVVNAVRPVRAIRVRLMEERKQQRKLLWSARTCPRFKSGDMSPHSENLAVQNTGSVGPFIHTLAQVFGLS